MAKSSVRRVWEDAGPDKGYSFVVLAALWLISFTLYMPVRGSGVLFHSIMMSMNITPGQATWPFSLIITVSSFASITCGYLQVLGFSTRQILLLMATLNILSCGLIFILPLDILWIALSMGVIYGFSHGLSSIAIHVIASEYFKKYRTLAVGLAYTGVSVFGLVGPPFILTPISDEYDIRGAFLFLGALSSHVFISAVLVRPRDAKHFLSLREKLTMPEKISIMAENQSIALTDDKVDHEVSNQPTKFSNCLRVVFPTELRFLMRNKLFGLLSFASSMGEISFFSFLAISVSTSVAKGVPEKDARLAITTCSAGEIISKFLIGSLVDKRIVSAENMFTTILVGMGASLMVFGWASRLWIILTSAFTFGLSFGAFFPVRTVVIGKRLGVKYISFALGNIRIISGFLYLLLPTITDALTENRKRFDNLCYFFGGLCLMAALVWTLQKCLKTNSESE